MRETERQTETKKNVNGIRKRGQKNEKAIDISQHLSIDINSILFVEHFKLLINIRIIKFNLTYQSTQQP